MLQEVGTPAVNQLMSLELAVQYTNDENPEEVKNKVENEMMLPCFIDKKLGHLTAGLQRGMEGQMVMQSQTLTNGEGQPRDATFTKETKVQRLPGYLAIQFNRFMMKNGNNDGERVQCKIGKAMKFSLELDMIAFCTPELTKKLAAQRNCFEQARDEEIERGQDGGSGLIKPEDQEFMDYSFPEDPGSNNSGYYELLGVVTHEGRTANSGHYVAWSKVEGKNWACFDDAKVTQHDEERVIKLGDAGADSAVAYMCIYGPKRCAKLDKPPAAAAAAAPAPAEDAPVSMETN